MELSSSSFAHIFYPAFISFFLIMTYCFASIPPLCHNEERLALLQFKQIFALNSTCSGTFSKLASWNNEDGNGNCCSWDGVECDTHTGYVIVLDLSDTCLYGSIDSNCSLFRLVHLQKLNLAYNNFNYSKIPEGIAQLSELRYLKLRASQFSGQIPYAITKLYHLSILDLSHNVDIISGTPLLELRNPDLKTLLLNLKSLQGLNLTTVNISSTIPDFLANFSSLRYLYMRQCGLQGKFPEKILQLQNLEYINLMYNPYLYGYLPEFNSNNSLKHLCLQDTGFYGKLPFSIGNLLWLNTLTLAKCKFLGSIPLSFGNLTELSVLDLGSNNFSGPFPCLGKLTKLKFLVLEANDFKDKTASLAWLGERSDLLILDLQYLNLDKNILSYLRNQTKLIVLVLSGNPIKSQFPSLIYNMSSLMVLNMDNNDMFGELPQWLGNFSTSLVSISLKDNMFQGSIPDSFGKDNNLKSVHLSNNQLQGGVPRSLSNCKMLEILVLAKNQLNGMFPFWLGSLPNLRVLILQSNEFHGPIGEPKSHSDFSSLHIIDLSYNNFSHNLPLGYIKNSWGTMKKISSHSSYLGSKTNVASQFLLSFKFFYHITIVSKGFERKFERIQKVFTVIDLSCNRFEGEIPYFIGNLKGLQLLNLSHNILTGQIPSSLENMTQIESLDLSYNNLSGNIPPLLSKLTFLVIFNVSYNNLSGPIPQGNQFDIVENSSYAGNPSLCGASLSNKCGDPKVKQEPVSTLEKEHDEQSSFFQFGWKIVLIGYGCGVVFGMVVGNYIISWKQEWFLRSFRMTPRRRRYKRRWRRE